jgi:hypothetical protein
LLSQWISLRNNRTRFSPAESQLME